MEYEVSTLPNDRIEIVFKDAYWSFRCIFSDMGAEDFIGAIQGCLGVIKDRQAKAQK